MLVLLACAACSAGQGPPVQQDLADTMRTADASEEARIERLEREARDIAKSDGCSSAGECRTAPVGERACGGPRDYIVYCARTTDGAGLYRKLAELRQAEIEYNRKSQIASTCEFRTPPRVTLEGGSCRGQQLDPIGVASARLAAYSSVLSSAAIVRPPRP